MLIYKFYSTVEQSAKEGFFTTDSQIDILENLCRNDWRMLSLIIGCGNSGNIKVISLSNVSRGPLAPYITVEATINGAGKINEAKYLIESIPFKKTTWGLSPVYYDYENKKVLENVVPIDSQRFNELFAGSKKFLLDINAFSFIKENA